MKMFNDAIDKVRRQEIAQLMCEGYESVLKDSRWFDRKTAKNTIRTAHDFRRFEMME